MQRLRHRFKVATAIVFRMPSGRSLVDIAPVNRDSAAPPKGGIFDFKILVDRKTVHALPKECIAYGTGHAAF
ncbi:hypothetical protein [Metarhizobium album]|uniref:hypothetical protein n=1 Tax=Metarhizobium album TaxID=2182425 RepID=UPI0014036AE9|nr:hypothetical protein [Rhizobium album]